MSQLPILAVAFAIYILGIATVLYIRPYIMFKPGGSWKEFGIGRGETHTVLPFWLFSIFWAFISYGVSLVVLSQFANIANTSYQPIPVQQPQVYQQGMPQISQQAPMPVPQLAPAPLQMTQAPSAAPGSAPGQAPGPGQANYLKPVSSMIGLQQNVPGYYVLANNAQNGAPQYIYYGSAPPSLTKY